MVWALPSNTLCFILIHTIDGEAWAEPPNYWEQIAYPSYVLAHSHLFHEGGVETGDVSQKASELGLLILDGQGTKKNMSFEDLFRITASAVLLKAQSVE